MAGQMTGFRSSPSRKPVFLRVHNATSRTVHLFWLDYKGRETTYGLIEPRSNKFIHSYEGHPWICREVRTKRKFLLNSKELFIPTAVTCENPNREGMYENIPFGITVTFPAISLQDACIDVIVDCLTSEDDVSCLNMPNKLSEAILECWQNTNTH